MVLQCLENGVYGICLGIGGTYLLKIFYCSLKFMFLYDEIKHQTIQLKTSNDLRSISNIQANNTNI